MKPTAIATSIAAIIAALASPPEAAEREAPRIPEDVEVIRDVVYGKGGGRDLKLDIVRQKARAAEPLPAVVWIHGGAWREGTKESAHARLARIARRGTIGAAIEYRLTREAIFPAQIEDAKCAVRFLRSRAKEYGIDPGRIAAGGESAGGHLAALLGTSGGVEELEGKGGSAEASSRVQAVVDLFGPTDFSKMGKGLLDHDAPGSPESILIGGPVQSNPAKVARANPITYAGKDDPPFLILHGDADPVVPFSQSELLLAALKGAGVDATLVPVKGAGHGFGGPSIDAAIDAFLDRVLRAKAGPPAGGKP